MPPLKGGETSSYNSDAGNLDWGFGEWPVSPIGPPIPIIWRSLKLIRRNLDL